MASETLPTNGHVIKALRVAYGIKLYELAKDVGITDGYLSNIERCRRDASAALLQRIASRLNVPLDAVVTVQMPEAGESRVEAPIGPPLKDRRHQL